MVKIKKQQENISDFIISLLEYENEDNITFEGGIVAFTNNKGKRGTMTLGDMSIMLRCKEEIKIQTDLLDQTRKNIITKELNKNLGYEQTSIPTYTN